MSDDKAKDGLYSYKELEARVKLLKGVYLSNQYGMLFILNEDHKIVLNVSALVSEQERMFYS